MPDLPSKPDSPPPGGFLEWLGRQVGFVSKAVKTDVTQPKVLFRTDTITEAPHPQDPNMKLRRTVIDEVVVEKPKSNPPGPANPA